MKVIGVFSGKGGVGKSTVASLLALSLSMKYKTALIDIDINTPSIPILFGGRREVGDLTIYSSGFDRDGMIDYTGAILRKYVRKIISDAKKVNPEIIVIDLPPGLTDIHLELIKILNVSFFLLVIQPNKLSEQDAIRTSHLFFKAGVPIVGIIENMVGSIFGKPNEKNILGLPTIISIPLNSDISDLGSSGRIDELINNPFLSISEHLYSMANESKDKIIPRSLFEGISFEEAMNEFRSEKLTFVGTKSWDEIRERIMENDPFSGRDSFLELCTSKSIREMLDHLDEDNSGLFMVLRAPNTKVCLFPGEVGIAYLFTEGKYYYGVPRVKYQTDQGDVVLFPYEISPISMNVLDDLIKEKELVMATHSKAPRYVPTLEMVMTIDESFGRLTGCLREDWEENYNNLFLIFG